MDSLAPGKLTGAQKEELMDQVKQQVAVLLAQELLQTWQSLWDQQVDNKLRLLKPCLGLWQSSVRSNRQEEVVLLHLRIGHSCLTRRHLLCDEEAPKITEKCFKKCINKPGTSLDNSEQKCIAMCMDRYMDSFGLVSRTYAGRLQREKGNL